MNAPCLGWLGIIRLGLVQTALGAIVVLTTSTMNRVMVVEFALPAMLPGALVALHYLVQILRPRLGYGSDLGGRRTPWIVGGMGVLALGGMGAAFATALMEHRPGLGSLLAVLAFTLIGVGVGASGTSLLVLLAKRVTPARRAPAATIVWLMMIAGFAITAGVAGGFLDPFTSERLVVVTSVVCVGAFLLTLVALIGVEGHGRAAVTQAAAGEVAEASGTEERQPPFREALAQVWSEPQARRFAIFVFVSMLAYSAQDLILEPFAGSVFGLTPGESTRLAGVQHSGVLLGMIVVALACAGARRSRLGTLRGWTIGGCLASALALLGLVTGGYVGEGWPLRASVFALGAANGVFAVAAIGSMMGMVADGRGSREGVRMGLWGAAQAIAFGIGGFLGTASIDFTRQIFDSLVTAYGSVFASQAVLFVISALLAARVARRSAEGGRDGHPSPSSPSGERFVAGLPQG